MLPARPSDAERLRVAPDFVRSIPVDVIFTVLLCGLWNLVVQARQIRAVNFMLMEDKYNFWRWLILTLVTCSLYHIYHEYKMTKDICLVRGNVDSDDPVIHLVLAIFGLSLVVDALQQSEINKYFRGSVR